MGEVPTACAPANRQLCSLPRSCGRGPTHWPVEDAISLPDRGGQLWTRPRSIADRALVRLLGKLIMFPLALEFVEKRFYWLLGIVPLSLRHLVTRFFIKMLVVVHRLFRLTPGLDRSISYELHALHSAMYAMRIIPVSDPL